MEPSKRTDELLALTGKQCVYCEGGTVMMGRVLRVDIEDDWGARFVIQIIPTEGFSRFRHSTTEPCAMWQLLSINEQGIHARLVNWSIIVKEDTIQKIKSLVLQGLDDNDFVRELIRVQHGV